MGELDESIFVIDSPEIDVMLSDRLPDLSEVRKAYEIPFSDYAIFMYHPVTMEVGTLKRNIESVLDALEESGMNYIAIYPNNDNGTAVIMEALTRVRGNPRFRLIPSVRFESFLTLMKHARAMVANSSAGIREAPVFGIPTINIGSRQRNRYNGSSILNVPEEKAPILNALNNLPVSVVPSLHFGKGESAKSFIEELRNQKLWRTPLHKEF